MHARTQTSNLSRQKHTQAYAYASNKHVCDQTDVEECLTQYERSLGYSTPSPLLLLAYARGADNPYVRVSLLRDLKEIHPSFAQSKQEGGWLTSAEIVCGFISCACVTFREGSQ